MGKINADEILQRGIELMKRERFKEAENEFKRIGQGDTVQYFKAQCYLIDIYFINKQWIRVIKVSTRVLENHCSDRSKEEVEWIRFRLGSSYLAVGRWEDAINTFTLIDKYNCKFYDVVLIKWACAHINLDQLQEAVKLLLQVSGDNQKRFDEARNLLGTRCLQKGLGMQAIKAFKSVSSKNYMLYLGSRISLGFLYFRVNQKSKAINMLQKISKENDADIVGNDADIVGKLYIETTYERSGLYTEAVQCCEDILNAAKGNSDICALVQYLLVEILVKRKVWEDESLRQKVNGLIGNKISFMSQFNKGEAFPQYANRLAIGKMYLIDNNFTKAENLFKNQENVSYYDSTCFLELARLLGKIGPEKVERIKWNSIEFLEIIDEIETKLLCAQNMNSVDYDALDASLEDFKEDEPEDIKLEDFEFAEYHGYEYKFAHYSRCETAFKLIGNSQTSSPSAFRLGSVGNVNDPKEGVVLGQYLGKFCNLPSDIFADKDPYATFVGCFTFNHDSLNQFRLYGKENNQEASGVSLVFLSGFFGRDDRAMHINNPVRVDDQDRKLKDEDDATNGTLKVLKSAMNERGDKANTDKPIKYNLYRCIYIDPETGYLSLARRDKATFYQECANSMNSEDLDSIREMAEVRWGNYSKIIDRKENGIRDLMRRLTCLIDEIYEDGANAKESVNKFMRIGLLKLQYLVKHAAYQEEQECRIIYITGWEDKKIRSDLRTMYVECDGSVVEHLDGIYLSPGAKDAKDHFRVLLRDAKIKREIKIRESRNPFRHR